MMDAHWILGTALAGLAIYTWASKLSLRRDLNHWIGMHHALERHTRERHHTLQGAVTDLQRRLDWSFLGVVLEEGLTADQRNEALRELAERGDLQERERFKRLNYAALYGNPEAWATLRCRCGVFPADAAAFHLKEESEKSAQLLRKSRLRMASDALDQLHRWRRRKIDKGHDVRNLHLAINAIRGLLEEVHGR